MKKPRVVLEVDGRSVPMNDFVKKIFARTVLGMIGSLDGIKTNPRQIRLTINREVRG
jgi:hypothetical protein